MASFFSKADYLPYLWVKVVCMGMLIKVSHKTQALKPSSRVNKGSGQGQDRVVPLQQFVPWTVASVLRASLPVVRN